MRCRIIVSKNIFIQLDHIVPLAIGGSNEDENFQILSSNCRKKETTEENKIQKMYTKLKIKWLQFSTKMSVTIL